LGTNIAKDRPGIVSYHALYLSPHFDDAVLSCGGQIYEQTARGERVLIVTVAAGEPQTEVRSFFAEYQHFVWGLSAEEAVAARRAEDARAAAQLGADLLTWSLPDAIYRLDPANGEPLYTSNEAIFGPVSPAEAPLTGVLAAQMADLPPASRVFAPLALGNHVDHQLVRAAAEQAMAGLFYYEDYPYVQREPETLEAALQPPEQWQSLTIPLSETAIAARIAAIGAYQSQLGMLFNGPESMARLVREQVQTAGGERCWYRRFT
jgi:LmbE family N-acetylglucosaminyl deacetylase